MIKRILEFVNGEYYHVFNRGVDKRKIFMDKGDLYYFFDAMSIANKISPIQDRGIARKKLKEETLIEKKVVSIVAYCLLPNHFHFILKQKTDGGISKFLQKLGASYVGFFNQKYERTGALFQGRFKATHLDKDGSLELTSAYVNLNYKHHKIDPKKFLVKTSLFEYLGEEKGEKVCSQEEIKNIVKESFGGVGSYKKYLKQQSKYFIERHNNKIEDIDFQELEN